MLVSTCMDIEECHSTDKEEGEADKKKERKQEEEEKQKYSDSGFQKDFQHFEPPLPKDSRSEASN